MSKCIHNFETIENDQLKIVRCKKCGKVTKIESTEPFDILSIKSIILEPIREVGDE